MAAELLLLTIIYLLFDVYIISPDIDLPDGKLNKIEVVDVVKFTDIT